MAAASLVYDAQGERVARYDKIHLFDVEIPGRAESYRESANMRAGQDAAPWSNARRPLGFGVL